MSDTASLVEHVRDNPPRVGGRPKTAELQVPGEQRGGRLQTRILCRRTEMVPGGRYFRICVASASADTAYSPLPHGRGGDGLPAPLKPGTRDADGSATGRVGSHPEPSSPRACSSTSRSQPAPARLRELLRPRSRLATSAPTNPGPTCALRALGPQDARRSPPSHAASHPHLGGKVWLLTRPHGSAGSRREQCLSPPRPPPTLRLTHRTVASSRGARTECPLPTTTPASLPGPRTHLQPTAAAGTSRGGQQESRRRPAAADSSRSPPPPSDEPQASEAGEPRARLPYNHLFPGARRCGERQGTRTARPLCRRPLLLFYPCRKGWGTPQHGFSQSRISFARRTQPSRVSLRSTRRTPPRSRTLAPRKPGNRNRPEAAARVR